MKPKNNKSETVNAPSSESANTAVLEAQPVATPAETIVVAAPKTLGEVITEGLAKLSQFTGIGNDEVREYLIELLREVKSFQPEKLVFSADKKERKLQMVAFKNADRFYRSSQGRIMRALSDAGYGELTDRHSFSVSGNGHVTLRRAEALKLKTPSTKIAGFRG